MLWAVWVGSGNGANIVYTIHAEIFSPRRRLDRIIHASQKPVVTAGYICRGQHNRRFSARPMAEMSKLTPFALWGHNEARKYA